MEITQTFPTVEGAFQALREAIAADPTLGHKCVEMRFKNGYWLVKFVTGDADGKIDETGRRG